MPDVGDETECFFHQAFLQFAIFGRRKFESQLGNIALINVVFVYYDRRPPCSPSQGDCSRNLRLH